MNQREIEKFFETLSTEIQGKTTVFLGGAAAASLMGSVRPSMDVDFAIESQGKNPGHWDKIQAAVEKTIRLTGIQANYAEDMDRWGQITLLDYKRHSHPFKSFGSLSVKLLDPPYWSIGKMTRYLDSDIKDMVSVFKNQKTPPLSLTRVWADALRKSPKSSVLLSFRKQVEDFLRTYGAEIWDKKFDAEKSINEFHRQAGIKP